MARILFSCIIFLILQKFDLTLCATQNQTPYGALMNTSITDVLSYGVNGNNEITKNILSTISEFGSKYDSYKTIKLSVFGYSLPSKFMEMNIGGKKAFFYNLTATQWFSNNNYNHKYTTVVACDSLGTAEIQVSLPSTVQITANLYLRSSSCDTDCPTAVGLITFTLKNGALSRTSKIPSVEGCSEQDIAYQITYNDSLMHAELGIENHQPFYEKSKTLINKIESSVGNYLLKQLNEQLAKRDISLSTTCSKFMKMRLPDKTHLARPCVTANKIIDLNKLYIIENVQFTKLPQVLLYVMQGSNFQMDEFIGLNAGPVVIEGLFNFSKIRVITSFVENYQSRDLYDKRQIVEIKTVPLTGKFSWYYNLKEDDTKYMLQFPFTVDYLTIERTIVRHIDITYLFDKFYVPVPQINLKMGKIRIVDSSKNSTNIYCEQQGKIEQVDLLEYLETVITTNLKNSIIDQINLNSTLYKDFFNN